MAEFLQGVGFFAIIGIIIGIRIYREEIILPRRKAKQTGKNVHIQQTGGVKTFRPDGSTSFHPYF